MSAPVRISVPAPAFVKATVPEPFAITPGKLLVTPVALLTVSVGVPAAPVLIVPVPLRLLIVGLWLFRFSVVPLARKTLAFAAAPRPEALPRTTVPEFTVTGPVNELPPFRFSVPVPFIVRPPVPLIEPVTVTVPAPLNAGVAPPFATVPVNVSVPVPVPLLLMTKLGESAVIVVLPKLTP